MTPADIVFTHSVDENDEITPAEIETLHQLYSEIVFQDWLKSRRFTTSGQRPLGVET